MAYHISVVLRYKGDLSQHHDQKGVHKFGYSSGDAQGDTVAHNCD